jgi:hypothetical protein
MLSFGRGLYTKSSKGQYVIDYELVVQDQWHGEYREYGKYPDEYWVYVVPADSMPYKNLEEQAVARVKFSGELWRRMFNGG